MTPFTFMMGLKKITVYFNKLLCEKWVVVSIKLHRLCIKI